MPQIKRDRLVEAIRTVLPAIARKEMFAQADKLAITGGYAVAYDDAVSIMHPLPELDGVEGAIDGRRLLEFLGKVSGDDVEVTVEVAGSELRISSSGIRARVSFTLAEVQLPISEIDQTGDYADLPDGFVDGLGMIAAACSKDANRPVLTCVRLGPDAIEASDGFRLARFVLGDDLLPDLLLPADAAELVSGSGVAEVALGGTGEWIRFRAKSGVIICARTFSGTFPDLGSLYQIDDGHRLSLPPGLRETIERAQVFAKRERKIDETIQVTMSPGKIVVKAEYDGGRFAETVAHREQADEGSFSIHPRFLAAALDDGSECVLGKSRIKFSSNSWEHVISLRS